METPDIPPVLELFDIPGYEDKYCATKDGRIYSIKKQKFLKQCDDTYNYLTVVLQEDGKGKTMKVHKLIAKTFLENPENKPQIDHINRIRNDNRVENLRYVSRSENCKNKNTRVNRSVDMRNILCKKSSFKVQINTKNCKTIKSFKTLDEAKRYRDSMLMTVPSQPNAL